MAIEKREFVKILLLTIVTCGIYYYIFIYRLANDMNTVCAGDGEETGDLLKFILFSIITCGIYAWYWYYKVAERQYKNAARYNVIVTETGSTVLLWMILLTLFVGIGVYIGMYMITKNMNTLANAYNIQNGFGDFNSVNFNAGNNFNNQSGQYDRNNSGGYAPQYGQGGYAQQYGQGGDGNATQLTQMNDLLGKTSALPQNTPSQYKLTGETGEFAGCEFELRYGETIKLGRALDNNIKFADDTPNVSRNHCTIKLDQDLYVMDNGSTFGTYTDGNRIQPDIWVRLQRGSSLWLGSEQVKFRIS